MSVKPDLFALEEDGLLRVLGENVTSEDRGLRLAPIQQGIAVRALLAYALIAPVYVAGIAGHRMPRTSVGQHDVAVLYPHIGAAGNAKSSKQCHQNSFHYHSPLIKNIQRLGLGFRTFHYWMERR